MHITTPRRARLLAALSLAALVLVGTLAACGGDDDTSAASTAGNGIDRAFVADMIPHHESAVEMANIARQRGQSAYVTRLASDIISSQTSEITEMRGIASRLDDAGVKTASLGLPPHAMGMDMDVSQLEQAKPFDRAFIDMMIPHHQGAIRMARVELAKGSNPQAKRLATQIIAAQTKEIVAMNKHRTAAFGAASPAGGVPAAGDKPDGEKHGMDHG